MAVTVVPPPTDDMPFTLPPLFPPLVTPEPIFITYHFIAIVIKMPCCRAYVACFDNVDIRRYSGAAGRNGRAGVRRTRNARTGGIAAQRCHP